MSVLYDHREARSAVPGLLALEGVRLSACQLPVGDYVLSERLVVERKTAADLVASIKDRRVFEQADRMKASFAAVVLIVEGDTFRFPAASVRGALAAVLTLGGVSVLRTTDPQDTAGWLATLARREHRGPAVARGTTRKPRDADAQRELALSAIPGVSAKTARALLEHFGTLRDVFAADEAALRAVPGVGPKRARDLCALASGRWREVPWQ